MNNFISILNPVLSKKGIKKCYRCKSVIQKGEWYRTSHHKVSHGRLVPANFHNLKRRYCADCTGFFLSRYSFFHVPDPNPQELQHKERYDRAIFASIYGVKLA